MAQSNSSSPQDTSRQWQQHLAGQLIAVEASDLSKWLETLLIPLLMMAACWAMNAGDPLLLKASFPWLWFAPLLVALRYGVLPGLISGILILIEWWVCSVLGIYGTSDFPREFFFAGALMILLAGEFSDVWRDRLERLDETNLYLVERLSGLTRRHLLLNLSHDRLEQEMLARPGSLRDALVRLRGAVMDVDAQSSQAQSEAAALPAAESLLQLLAQYVNIETAALYLAREQAGQIELGRKVAELGEAGALEAGDELLLMAAKTRNLAHVASTELTLERNTRHLVVAPLLTSDDRVVGVLAIDRLPFFSLNVENLQMMSVILAYYADCVTAAPVSNEISRRLPDIPSIYAEEFGRLMYMQRNFNIVSHLVVLTFRGARQLEMPSELLRIKRGLDLYWETRVDGHPAIAVLMPFASASAKEGFLERINDWLKSRFGANFQTLEVDVRSISFATGDPLEALATVIEK
jgi:hypothetical protein